MHPDKKITLTRDETLFVRGLLLSLKHRSYF